MTATRLTPRVPSSTDDDDDDSLKKEQGPSAAKFQTVAKRLEQLFGTGENPQLRRRLYIRMQRCAIEHGPDCYSVIRACVSAAQSADSPDRYFCTSVVAEMKSLGYWDRPNEF